MIKVVIVDDNSILRTALKIIIEQDEEIKVVGIAENGLQGYELCKKLKPHIVLMDIKMPVCDGVESTKLIKENLEGVMVVILTTFEDEEFISQALLNGADGYILKSANEKDLTTIIKSTLSGYSIIQKKVFSTVKNQYSTTNINKCATINNSQLDKLTEREKAIIKCIAEGKSYRDIAEQLNFAEGTIRNITSDILDKLRLKDRTQIVIFAMKNGLV